MYLPQFQSTYVIQIQVYIKAQNDATKFLPGSQRRGLQQHHDQLYRVHNGSYVAWCATARDVANANGRRHHLALAATARHRLRTRISLPLYSSELGGVNITGYSVYMASDTGLGLYTTTTSATAVIAPLSQLTTYQFVVVARNTLGDVVLPAVGSITMGTDAITTNTSTPALLPSYTIEMAVRLR